MSEDTEVKVNIKVDGSGVAPALKPAAQGFQNAAREAKRAEGAGMSFIKNVAAQAIAFNIGSVVDRVKGVGMSFIDAAAGSQEARRSMAATAVVLEGVPWDKAAAAARKAQTEMNGIGMAAGFGASEVHAAYDAILESTDGTAASIARSKEELAGTAKIADMFGMSLEGAGREVAMMHEGLLRTRGHMFQLLRSTGIFGSDTHKAAKGWMAMTEDERTKRLAFGLTQVGEKLNKLPTSYHRLIGQVGATFEGMKKDIGEPIVEALTPAIAGILPKLTQMRADIRGIAQQFAPGISHIVATWAQTIEEKFQYINNHATEIKAAIESGFTHAKEVVEFILAHKTALAIAFGAKSIAPGVIGAAGTVANMVGTVASGAGGARGFGHAGTGLLGVGSTVAGGLGSAGTGAAVAASAGVVGLVAGITGLGYAAFHLIDGLNDRKQDLADGRANLMALAQAGKLDQLQQSIATMREMHREQSRFSGDMIGAANLTKEHAHAIELESYALDHLDDATRNFYRSLRAEAEAVQNIKLNDHEDVAREIQNASDAIADAYRMSQGSTDAATQAYAQNIYANQAALLVDAYNTAVKAGDSGAAALAATTIGSSNAVAQAFLKSTTDIEGGFGAMADTLMAGGSQFAALAGQLRAKVGGSAETMKPPVIAMSGGQQFHITQDFRNADPDNVAIVMQRDFGRLITRRLGANTSSAFGT